MPQLDAEVDRVKAKAQGVPLTELFDTLQTYLGSAYVNDFNLFGRTWQVIAQADGPFRDSVEDIANLRTRNAHGEMVPIGSMVTIKQTYGPDPVLRFNGYPAADLLGEADPRVLSSAQAMAKVGEIAAQVLPNGMGFDWSDLSYQEATQGKAALVVFPLAILLAFLVLAALYESWTLPLAVILIVPMCMLSALLGVKLTGGDNNTFVQVGLVVLMGLACKNAILIVEFARELELQGKGIVEAALEACRLRLRPIVMTSIAFIAGTVPLVLSHGAGAEVRSVTGITVFAGMLGVTLFGLFLTPVFYVGAAQARRAAARDAMQTAAATGGGSMRESRNRCARRCSRSSSSTLTACAVGPDYAAPGSCRCPSGFAAGATAADATRGGAAARRRRRVLARFDDPLLDELVETALAANHDLRIALRRFDQANALLREARLRSAADRAPQAPAPATRARAPTSCRALARDERDADSYAASVVAGWELDLFGRIRRNVEAQRADTAASAADLAAAAGRDRRRGRAQLRGAARSAGAPARRARAMPTTSARRCASSQARLDAGRGTEFDTSRARAQLETTLSRVPALAAAVDVTMHRLAVLTGQAPEALARQARRADAVAGAARRGRCRHARRAAAAPSRRRRGRGAPALRRPRASAWRRRTCSRASRSGGLIGTQAFDTERAVRARQRDAARRARRRLVVPRRRSRARAHRAPATPSLRRAGAATSRPCCWRSRRPRTRSCVSGTRASRTRISSRRRSTARAPRSSRACASMPARSTCSTCWTPSARNCRRRTRLRTRACAARPRSSISTSRWRAAGRRASRSANR